MQPFEMLEKEFGEWSGCKSPNTVACSSGTAALHLALEALKLPLGSQIIIPDFTMVACARAVVMAGHDPVFCDCGDNLLMDPTLIPGLIKSGRTAAIMAVHIYGRRCNMDAIHDIAHRYGLSVIEDMAELHGVAPHPYTDAACWSFYKNKVISGEEGGLVSFRREGPASLAKSLRSLGFTEEHDYRHIPRGHNYRMSNAHARLVLTSLHQVDTRLRARRTVCTWYDALLHYVKSPYKRDSVWVYDVRLPGVDVAKVVKALNTEGVAARMSFKPMRQQEEFGSDMTESNAAKASREVLYLPVRHDMDSFEVQMVVETFNRILTAYTE